MLFSLKSLVNYLKIPSKHISLKYSSKTYFTFFFRQVWCGLGLLHRSFSENHRKDTFNSVFKITRWGVLKRLFYQSFNRNEWMEKTRRCNYRICKSWNSSYCYVSFFFFRNLNIHNWHNLQPVHCLQHQAGGIFASKADNIQVHLTANSRQYSGTTNSRQQTIFRYN